MDSATFFLCVALNRAAHPSIQGDASKVLIAPESMWMIEGSWNDMLAFTDGIRSWDARKASARFMVVPKIASEFNEGSRNFIALNPMGRECGYLQMTAPNETELSASFIREFAPTRVNLNIEKLGMAAAGEISSAKDIAEFVTFAFESARALIIKNELSREVGGSCKGSKRPEARL